MGFDPISMGELLELWRKIFPISYTEPIEDEGDGQGFDLYTQQAAQFARVADAVNVTAQAYYLRPHSTQTGAPASGAVRATGTVQITRTPPAVGSFTLIAGTLLVSVQVDARGVEIEGVTFRLLEDVTLPGGSTAPVLASIEAERVGYQGNLPAARIDRFLARGRATIEGATVIAPQQIRDTGTPDRFTAGMVGQFVRLATGLNAGTYPRRIVQTNTAGDLTTIEVDGPALTADAGVTVQVLEFADLGLTVEQLDPTTGGKHGWLDAIGFDRNAARALNEDDEAYRLRLASLDDTISPAAIMRIANRVLSPLGIPWRFQETRDTWTGTGLIGFILDHNALDWGSFEDGIVLIDEAHAVRFFILRVGLSGLGDFGSFYDAPNTPNPNAADVAFLDGYALGYVGALRALWKAVEAARAAGVAWEIVIDPSL